MVARAIASRIWVLTSGGNDPYGEATIDDQEVNELYFQRFLNAAGRCDVLDDFYLRCCFC